MSSSDLTELAWALVSDELVGTDAAVAAVARTAAERGVSPALVAALTDRRRPLVVRQRAFGLVAAALDAERSRPTATHRAAA